jgi:phage N-6-adenine-methyltransferase
VVNAPVFFESAGDERGTPQQFFDALNAEFGFDIDCAASAQNKKCELYFGFGSALGTDALEQDWGGSTCFLNPPYSTAGAFVAKARQEADKGATVVMLLPVRTDTRWWHAHVWDKDADQRDPLRIKGIPDGTWRAGVRGRFLPGRLTFELHVPPEMRAWVKAEAAGGTAVETLIKATGLPKMAIDGILLDRPDDCLLSGAPFPSCVVIFERAEAGK